MSARALLYASLAVNLLVLGAVAGALATGARLTRDQPQEVQEVAAPTPPAAPRGRLMEMLPEDRRAAVRAQIVAAWRETSAERETARAARRAVVEAAQREPFDEEAFAAALAELRAANQAVLARFDRGIVAALSGLSPEERRAALEAAARSNPGGGEARREGLLQDRPMLERPTPDGALRERVQERVRDRLQERREERRNGGEPSP